MSATMNLDDGLSPDMTAAGSAVVRGVQFVCPLCGADRDGSYVEDPSGTAWVQCHECSYLAIVWCRRLAPELSLWGKTSFLDNVTRPVAGALTREQREVVVQLGVALQMPPASINHVLDAA